MVPLAVRQAWKTMVTGRPGPVVLDVPFDVFMEAAAEETPKPRGVERQHLVPLRRRSRGRRQGGRHAAVGAERPGHPRRAGRALRRRRDELLQLAERLQIPVAASASGLGAIDAAHPLALGLVARGGHYQANHATRQADVLLALGVRFDDRTSSSWIPGYSFTIPPTKLIHVDIDPDEIGRNYPVALGLMADVRTFLRQVLAELDRRTDLTMRADARKKWLDGDRRLSQGMGRAGRAGLHRRQPRRSIRSAQRYEIDRGAAEGCHPGQRHRRASQLAPPVTASRAGPIR